MNGAAIIRRAVCILIFFFATSAVHAELQPEFFLREVNGKGGKAPVTLSFLAGRGEYFGQDLQPVIDGVPHTGQVDVRSTWPDGSIAHALITTMVDVEPNANHNVTISRSYSPPENTFRPAPLFHDLQFEMRFRDTAGRDYEYVLDPFTAFLMQRYAYWGGKDYRNGVFGNLRRDYEFRFRPTSVSDGSEHGQIEILLRISNYHRDYRGALAEIIVENSRIEAVKHDVFFESGAIKVGRRKATLLDLAGKQLLYQTRFALENRIEKNLPRIEVRPGIPYLASRGFLAPVDWNAPIADGRVQRFVTDMMKSSQRGDFDPDEPLGIPMNRGPIYRYMPGTGDRKDIGWFPSWAYCYFNSWSDWGKSVTMAADMNGSGVYPIHNRDNLTGELGLEHGHDFWEDKIKWEPDVDNIHPPNTAHLPLLGYTSYVITGRKIFLEELVCWTAYTLRYNYPNNGKIDSLGGRKGAWAIRNVALTAAILPDDHPFKAYVNDRMRATAREWSQRLDRSLPLGTYGNGGWGGSGRKQWPMAKRTSPWMNAWFSAMCELGERLHGVEDLAEMYRHNWKYFRLGYLTEDTWRAPDGTLVVADPDQLMQYSKAISVYTPMLDERGKWDETSGSTVPLTNFAMTQWFERVAKDHAWGTSDPPPDFPAEGPEPWHWRPIGPYSDPSPSRYHEYGVGRVNLHGMAVLRGLPQAAEVFSVVEPWIQDRHDSKNRPAGMRMVPYPVE